MPNFTDHLRLAIFLANEQIDINEESIRMHTIDSQVLGLYEIFGNGILEGWDVTESNGLSVIVSEGSGHIGFMSAISEESETITDLAPNAELFIFASLVETTPEFRTTIFSASTTDVSSDNNILLATVITDDDSIVSIDTSVRNDISFLQLILDEINKHVHRGGSNPSKVDLASEVRGRLSQSNIADLAASIVQSGRFDLARMPKLDHNELLNNGVLTHAQIDSYIKNLQNRNTLLFGELSVNNFLQTVLALKHIWSSVDDLMVNELAIIPGISPDLFLDENNSNAIIDKIEHTISGSPANTKNINFARFTSSSDFENANSQNLTIDGASAELSLLASEIFVEDFESVNTGGIDVPNWSKETVSINSSSAITSSSTEVVNGGFGGTFTSDEDVRLNYTFDLVARFGEIQDWTNFNQLSLQIKTDSLEHGQINLSLIVVDPSTSDDKEIGFFTVLPANSITDDFEEKILDISSLTKDQVKKIVLYTDTSIGWEPDKDFTFHIDDMKVENTEKHESNGFIRFRFNTPQPSTWSSVSFSSTTPSGTDIQIRARTGSSAIDLDNASFGAFSGDGDPLDASDSTHIEIEASLSSNPDQTSTPELTGLTLTYLTNSTSTSFTITSSEDWESGVKFTNIDTTTPDEINILNPIRAKELFFSNENRVGQIDRDNVPTLGFDGADLPLSPKQASNATPKNKITGFNYVADIKRKENRNLVITDTFNDRVLELTSEGEFVKGWVTDAVNSISGFFPLTSSIRANLSILSVSFTNPTDLTLVDLSKFKINSRGGTIILDATLDKVVDLFGNEVTQTTPLYSKVVRVLLSETTKSQLELLNSFDLFIRIDSGGLSAAFDDSSISAAIENSLFGLPVFRGDMIYVDGIFNPVAVELLDDDNLLIANAKSLSASRAPSFAVNSVMEIDQNGISQGGNNVLDFSVFSLGGIKERDEDTYIIAGYDDPASEFSPEFISPDAPDPFATSEEEEPSSTATAKSATAVSELDTLLTKRGRVVIIDKLTFKILFSYESPEGLYPSDVQIDNEGLFVISEKSFKTKNAGRIIKVDEEGNVVFQFGFGKITRPNDVRVLENGNLLISA